MQKDIFKMGNYFQGRCVAIMTRGEQMMTRAVVHLPVVENLPPFTGATQWLNSSPLTPADLRGKVVLVNFWTYTCVNWIRTLPYIRAWAKKYQDQGLVVVGVHTPEFGFEHNVDNVQLAMRVMQVDYPVVVDNKYAIWNAFANHYWPALYFVDAKGRIRYQQFGEGEYEMAERAIQQLLIEAGATDIGDDLVSVEPQGIELPADWQNVESPETYLGYDRASNFASPGGAVLDRRHVYQKPELLQLNQWALTGDWSISESAAQLQDVPGKISFRFHARDLNLVMGPVMRGTIVKFHVWIDNAAPGDAHGEDIDPQGNGKVTKQRLYQLIRSPGPIKDHVFEIEFLDPGVEVFVFTFG